MPKSHLTTAAVARIKPPLKGQVDHFDAGYPGLALRLSYGGRRTWVLFYRQDGKLRRATLGTAAKGTEAALEPGALGLAAARDAWRAARERIKKGLAPIAAEALADDAKTVRKVVERWLDLDQKINRKHRTPARSFREVNRIMHRDVLPVWGDKQIADITFDDVQKLIDGFVSRGKLTQACRLYARLHRLFRWSTQQRIIAASPMENMARPAADAQRKRALSDEELRIVWHAARDICYPVGTAFQLLILTFARRTEIGALRWDEIDGTTDEIRLESDRTKNGEEHVIPLSRMAWEVLETVPRLGTPHLFSPKGSMPTSGWARTKDKIDERLRAELGNKFKPWRTHDLRRTGATGLERLGVPLQVTEALLGHTAGSKSGIVGVYQIHKYEKEKRDAAEKWAQRVAELVNGAPGVAIAARLRQRSTRVPVATALKPFQPDRPHPWGSS